MTIQCWSEVVEELWNLTKFKNHLLARLISLGYQELPSFNDELKLSIKNSDDAEVILKIKITQNTSSIKIQAWQENKIVAPELERMNCLINCALDESFPIKFVSLSSPEVKVLLWQRSDNQSGLGNAGFIFPLRQPDWCKKNAILAVSASQEFNELYIPGIGKLFFFPEQFPSQPNFFGDRDLVKSLILCRDGGIFGQTSDDIGVLAAGGMGSLNTYQINDKTWLNVNNGRSIAFNIVHQTERIIEVSEPKVLVPFVSPSPSIPEPELKILSPINCGEMGTISGGYGFTRTDVLLGEKTGTVTFNYQAFSMPDRFIVVYDEEIVIDTGYRGKTNWNPYLNDMGYPNVSGDMEGSASFEKTTTTKIASVFVHGPLSMTGWEFTLSCPN